MFTNQLGRGGCKYAMSLKNLLLRVHPSLQSYPVYVTGQNEMFSGKNFKPRLILNFLCLPALIHEVRQAKLGINPGLNLTVIYNIQ